MPHRAPLASSYRRWGSASREDRALRRGVAVVTTTTEDSPLRALDPRAGLAWQVGFSVAAFGARGPAWFLALGLLAAGTVRLAGLSLRRVLREYWILLALLATGPIGAGIQLGPPPGAGVGLLPGGAGLEPIRLGVDAAAATASLRSVSRVVLVLLVAASFLRTTPVREARAAVQWALPGRLGRLFGAGVAVSVRFLPLVSADLRRRRTASVARLGNRRGVLDRIQRLAVGGLADAFDRADRLALALRSRCFAWNPTPPRLQMAAADYLVVVASLVLAVGAVGPALARTLAGPLQILLGAW